MCSEGRAGDTRGAAFRRFAGLRHRVDCRVWRTGDIKCREPERVSRIVRDQHLQEVLIGVAEVKERNVKRSGSPIYHRIRERQGILRMSGIRIRGRGVNCLGNPGCASILRAPEAQLYAGALKTRPRNINIIPIIVRGVGADRQPFFVAVIIHLHDDATAPRAAAVHGPIYANHTVALGVGGEVGKIEDPMAVHAHRGIAEGLGAARGRRHEPGLPRLATIGRRPEAR